MPVSSSYATPSGNLAYGARMARVPAEVPPESTKDQNTAEQNDSIALVDDSSLSASAAEAPPADGTTYKESPFPRLFGRLKSLGHLEAGWNSYGTIAPNNTAIFWAHRVLHELADANLPPVTITASSDEGVALVLIRDSKRASIECLNSGDILAVFSEEQNAPQVWPIPHEANDMKQHIGTIRKLLAR